MGRRSTVPGTCNVPGCDAEAVNRSRCPAHPYRQLDDNRPTATERGYSTAAWRKARAVVLERDPVCVVCGVAESRVADHHPRTRRALVADPTVLSPDAPFWMRGLCRSCHQRKPLGT